MKDELEKKFYERWPAWFNRTVPPVRGGFWGFECGDGWFDLIWSLCVDLETLVGDNFVVQQVKEKFGTLRFYAYNVNSGAELRIRQAEGESSRTCMLCGQPGEERYEGWIVTLCDPCNTKRNERG